MKSTSKESQKEIGQSLLFSEVLILISFSICYFFCISITLTGVRLATAPLIKQLPSILFFTTLIFHQVGILFNQRQQSFQEKISKTWPFICLSLLSIVGSLVALFYLNVRENFLSFGISMMFVFGGAISITTCREIKSWISGLTHISLIFSVLAILGCFAHKLGLTGVPDGDSPTHEIEFLVLCPLFVAYYWYEKTSTKVLIIFFLILGTIATQKLSGYIIGLLALGHIYIEAVLRTSNPKWKKFITSASIASVCVFGCIAVLVYFEFRSYFPSGNADVRFNQYERAFNAFIASPIWGTAYTDASGEYFKQGDKLFYIPTHSDLLDMLRHGGLLAISLWLIGIVKVLILFTKAIRVQIFGTKEYAYFLGIRFFTISSILNYAFNPLLVQPPIALLIWITIGFGIGFSLDSINNFKRRTPL